MQPVILHIDMNSYFASVEQQANPFLRGKPIGVCAYLSENGCVLASSMEAKKKGVKTAMRVRNARELCPQMIFLQNDPAKYRSTTEKIFSILAEYSECIEPYSIDEAFIDLTGHAKSLTDGEKIGREISTRIKKEVGVFLRSSVGIAETRFIAKLVSDTIPKDSVVSLSSKNLPSYLKKIELEEIWGIGKGMKRRLADLDITTPLELQSASSTRILATLRRPGYYLWASLNGIELHEIRLENPSPKSIGHSYCLPKKTKDPAYLAKILMKLSEKTGRRLRAKDLDTQSIALGYRLLQSGGRHTRQRLPVPLFDSLDIFRQGWRLLEADKLQEPVTMLAISVGALKKSFDHPRLFTHPDDKKRPVLKALDEINDRWGDFTVTRGAMWGTEKNAHDRIGFRKTLPVPEIKEKV